MRETRSFTSSSDFNNYILSYMLDNKLEEAYVSLRYGYTKEEMKKADFEIQVCGIFNLYDLLWWIDWWEGQEFIELQAIISPEIVRLCAKFEESEILKLLKEN
jgi:hypothetical protein